MSDSIKELQNVVRDFCVERDWDQFHGAKDLAIGLITEAAELLEHFRFLDAAQIESKLQTPESREQIGHELADCLFFVLRFADRFHFHLGEELIAKMKINAQKYPAEEFRGRNYKSNR